MTGMPQFELVSDFAPAGDQPAAIDALARGIEEGERFQTLLGITGSGKSFTVAGVIARVQRPTLVLAPNKSLAAQLTGEVVEELEKLVVFPASHYVVSKARMDRAIARIEAELADRLTWLEQGGKLLEAQRLRMRTTYDLEMLREVGVCSGIENYSRHLDGRDAGQRPYTLLDYFPKDFLTVIDESHVAVPQLHGQYEGDRSRKETLVEHGFRLPSALDNRPLRFEEFVDRVGQVVF